MANEQEKVVIEDPKVGAVEEEKGQETAKETPEVKEEGTKKEEEVIIEVEEEEGEQEVIVEGEKKEETEEKVPEKKAPIKVDVQARIDRMYARLQEQTRKAQAAEVGRDLMSKRVDENTEEKAKDKPLTKTDIEGIWDLKDKQKRFKASETRVLMRHPDALNEDGSFNMNSEFSRRYIEIGKANPMLVYMENGPELAEAQVEKEGGLSYKKGRTDEAKRGVASKNAHTGASTTASKSAAKIVKISAVEAKIATRMGMTTREYVDYKSKIAGGNRRARV